MSSPFMTLEARRAMHAEAVAASSSCGGPQGDEEAGIFEALRRFNVAERRKIGLLASADADDLTTEVWLARLGMEQATQLEAMCSLRATTLHGHRARSLAYSAWDGGNLAYRIAVGETVDDMVLRALIRDLGRRTHP